MNDWIQRDLKSNWHPYTRMSALEDHPPLLIERAKGIKLYDASGRWYYDTTSSWWCNVHGHGHPRICEAIARQARLLDHVLFAGVAHRPAIELAERLVAISPPGLERVFYSDDGSTAVEVALKMSLQYWRNVGRPEKKRFVCLEHGYHGDTVGAMSVSGVKVFRQAFEPLLFDVHKVTCPSCYRCPLDKKEGHCRVDCIRFLEQVLEEHGREVAALIMEPLLMAAGGMITYPSEYLKLAGELARRYDVHLILDEVATGFGRTGTMFACRQAGVSPDFLCLSKGITSGTLPLAGTLTTEEVYSGFLGPTGSGRTFYHGHTYTANPIGCAAALASLELFETERVLDHVRDTAPQLHEGIAGFSDLPHVGDVRYLGMVGALELVSDKDTREPLESGHPLMGDLYRAGIRRGVILRPLGNVVYLFLPLCTTGEELADILTRLGESLDEVLEGG